MPNARCPGPAQRETKAPKFGGCRYGCGTADLRIGLFGFVAAGTDSGEVERNLTEILPLKQKKSRTNRLEIMGEISQNYRQI
jgi:hypothetical protein